MIEINLLPGEYRVQERTPLGLILTIVVGMMVVGGIGIAGISLKQELTNATNENGSLTQESENLQKEVDKVEKLKREIENAKKRQNTIIEISQSKIMWSQKLVQFGKIMADYPDFWIDRMSLAKGGKGAGILTLNFSAVGNDLRKIAAFREKISGDTNFWYHFDSFDAPTVTITEKGGALGQYGYTGPIMNLAVTMPVK